MTFDDRGATLSTLNLAMSPHAVANVRGREQRRSHLHPAGRGVQASERDGCRRRRSN